MAFSHSRLFRLPVLALAGLMPAAGCGDPDAVVVDEVRSQKVREASPAVAAADRQALADGNAAFAMALYRQVQANNPNLVFSPTSISTALAMTFAGARGDTETQMATALRFTLPQARLHPAINEVTAALARRGEGTMGADGKAFRLTSSTRPGPRRASRWSRPSWTSWAELRRRRPPARLHRRRRGSRQTINRWVEQQTEDRIKDPHPRGDHRCRHPAGAHQRRLLQRRLETPLRQADRRRLLHPRRRQRRQRPDDERRGHLLKAATLPGLVAVALPYQDERLSMLLVLPDAGKLAEVEGRWPPGGPGGRDVGPAGDTRSSCACRGSTSRRPSI